MKARTEPWMLLLMILVGAIIGSLFIQALERNPTPEAAVHDLLRTIGRE